tara:strand:+ start:777 stop:1052 length:276 start_codon:yes stop_codon:yes gene_type:complete
MTYSELSKLSISELRNLNSMVIETIKSKKSLLALETKDSLYVGAIVSVDHKKMAGHELKITKINRTKAVCEMINGTGSYNVPLTMINIING